MFKKIIKDIKKIFGGEFYQIRCQDRRYCSYCGERIEGCEKDYRVRQIHCRYCGVKLTEKQTLFFEMQELDSFIQCIIRTVDDVFEMPNPHSDLKKQAEKYRKLLDIIEKNRKVVE